MLSSLLVTNITRKLLMIQIVCGLCTKNGTDSFCGRGHSHHSFPVLVARPSPQGTPTCSRLDFLLLLDTQQPQCGENTHSGSVVETLQKGGSFVPPYPLLAEVIHLPIPFSSHRGRQETSFLLTIVMSDVVPPLTAADWVRSCSLLGGNDSATPFASVSSRPLGLGQATDPLVMALTSAHSTKSLLGMAELELELCSFESAAVHAMKALEQATTLTEELASRKALIAAKENFDRDGAAELAEESLLRVTSLDGRGLLGVDFYRSWFSERVIRLRHRSASECFDQLAGKRTYHGAQTSSSAGKRQRSAAP